MTRPRQHIPDRCSYIGGSDARIIMGRDSDALLRLWREKRGEAAPQDLSGDLVVQFGCATEALNRLWFERETGRQVDQVQRFARHPTLDWMGATLDGWVAGDAAVFEAKFMLPWNFSEESAVEKHMPQMQHNMLVTGARRGYLSILTGGAKWVLVEVEPDPVYQTVLMQIERIFWRCVRTGEPPQAIGAEPPRAKVPALRIIDMSTSNAWSEQAAILLRTKEAHAQHESARGELKVLLPEDAREAFGHGVRAKRSKSGAVTFELTPDRTSHALVQ